MDTLRRLLADFRSYRFWLQVLAGIVASLAIIVLSALYVALSRDGDSTSAVSRAALTMTSADPTATTPTSTTTDVAQRTPAASSTPSIDATQGTRQQPQSPGLPSLQSGAILTLEIGDPDQEYQWFFEGIEDQFVVVRMDRDPTGNVKPALELLDPFGSQVASDDSWTGYAEEYAQIEYRLKSTGRFRVVAKDRRGDGFGPFSIRFRVDPFEDITLGRSVIKELSLPGEKQYFVFEAARGQTVSARVDRDPSGNVKPAITLLDPFGKQEAAADSWNTRGIEESASFEERLVDTGSFLVVVQDRQGNGYGRYTLQVNVY